MLASVEQVLRAVGQMIIIAQFFFTFFPVWQPVYKLFVLGFVMGL
jgi:hypothetical protein